MASPTAKKCSRLQKPENIMDIIHDEISKVFVKVLECAGVYKRTEDGQKAFMRFVESL